MSSSQLSSELNDLNSELDNAGEKLNSIMTELLIHRNRLTALMKT